MLAPLLPTAVIAPSGEATAYLYDENGLLVGLEQGDRRYYMITEAVGTRWWGWTAEAGVELNQFRCGNKRAAAIGQII
ncbi:hypothetical protein D3C73_1429990 [compost metagenome]